MKLRCAVALVVAALSIACRAQQASMTVGDWQMQDVAKVADAPAAVSSPRLKPSGWYKATVPGTVLTTLFDNGVYPDPLYGENMRSIPESLNKTSYWYRTVLHIPANYRGRRVWLHFGGVNYSAQVWLNGSRIGAMRGAFARGDFDVTDNVAAGRPAVLAVLVTPQPHPGIPHEHTVALGMGHNGGDTAIDGPTFLSTIGWDWIPAVRDRDTGIWLPVTLSASGPAVLKNPFVRSDVSLARDTADLSVSTSVQNATDKAMTGKLVGTISGLGDSVHFEREIALSPKQKIDVAFDKSAFPQLHLTHPKLWWPNGYGAPNLYTLSLKLETAAQTSDELTTHFGIRKVEYEVPGSGNLTLTVNGVKVMARGGDWGMDDALKRLDHTRLDAEFHMHQIAGLNMIRNWVGQSTSPEFYDLADQYGILLWDEFFQPNPSDGPDVADLDTYLANVTDKVLRYRIHPSIVVWCARNEGHPPAELDAKLATTMAQLDPQRLYQSSSTDGRGISSHGPYYWRSPRFFYQINEAFKTETGSVSVPTIESIQGMMPKKDWESIDDDWAQHDMASGAQRGDEYPQTLAKRYGHIRNLADFVRKSQLANYEAFRAMYESRNASMFQNTTGVLTWMSHPAQPSFVWQLYHYDLEPNSALYATQKANESIHVQMNEANRTIEVVNNLSSALHDLHVVESIYTLDGKLDGTRTTAVKLVGASASKDVYTLWVNPHISELYFVKLDLKDASGKLLSTNLYWQNVAQDDFAKLQQMPLASVEVRATPRVVGDRTIFDVTVSNPGPHMALMTHLQLHRRDTGARVLPVLYSENYLNLAPGESRTLTIEAATHDVGGNADLLVDGYNVAVVPVSGPVGVAINENAQPMHWPASAIVADPISAVQP